MPKLVEADVAARPPLPRPRRKWWKRREFLLIIVGIHLLFGVGAGSLVVSHYTAARKLTFQAGPKSPNRSERAIQHKVQLQEKMKTAPPTIPKRVLSTGLAKIALPPLPDISGPKDAAPAPLMPAAGQNAKFGAQSAMIGLASGTGAGA